MLFPQSWVTLVKEGYLGIWGLYKLAIAKHNLVAATINYHYLYLYEFREFSLVRGSGPVRVLVSPSFHEGKHAAITQPQSTIYADDTLPLAALRWGARVCWKKNSIVCLDRD